MTVTCIDLFAGAGGFTEGATQAGAHVTWAANHWRSAVDCHAINHPDSTHSCQDLHQADWTLVPGHDLLLASPACQGHSTAGQPTSNTHTGRGASGSIRTNQALQLTKKKHDADRSTAWAVISALECHRTPVALIENVAAFGRWSLFPCWLDALDRLGYTTSTRVFDAAEFGVPQNRKRIVVAATLKATGTLRLSSPSDAAPGLSVAAIGPHLDRLGSWSDDHSWKPISSKPAGARARLLASQARQGPGSRFVTCSAWRDHRGRSIDRPIGCITTKACWGLVRGDDTRMLNTAELRAAMSFPDTYALPAQSTLALRLLGNAIPPAMARDLVRQGMEHLS